MGPLEKSNYIKLENLEEPKPYIDKNRDELIELLREKDEELAQMTEEFSFQIQQYETKKTQAYVNFSNAVDELYKLILDLPNNNELFWQLCPDAQEKLPNNMEEKFPSMNDKNKEMLLDETETKLVNAIQYYQKTKAELLKIEINLSEDDLRSLIIQNSATTWKKIEEESYNRSWQPYLDKGKTVGYYGGWVLWHSGKFGLSFGGFILLQVLKLLPQYTIAGGVICIALKEFLRDFYGDAVFKSVCVLLKLPFK